MHDLLHYTYISYVDKLLIHDFTTEDNRLTLHYYEYVITFDINSSNK